MRRDFYVDDIGFSFGNLTVEPIILQSGDGGQIVLPDPSLLFRAEFARDGRDLILHNDSGQDVRIVDYFAQSPLPDLHVSDSTKLRGELVEKLAGPLAPGQYAQAAQNDQTPIG